MKRYDTTDHLRYNLLSIDNKIWCSIIESTMVGYQDHP